MKYLISAGEIFTEMGIIKDGCITVDNDIISGINKGDREDCREIDMRNYRVIPGLIDMHIHGANGFDTMDASYNSLNEMSKYLARNGVAAFLPTTVTAEWGKTINALKNVKDTLLKGVEGATILGAYVEGPYICAKQKGAHPEEFIRKLSIDELKELISASGNTIRVVAIAPEIEGAIDAISFLKEKGINVSMGHTDAIAGEVREAVRAGANIAVHTFNAMRGIHHRDPGAAGAVLILDEVYAELIADGIHVHPDIAKILLSCKGPDKTCLITDCMMAGGLSDGEYMLGELKVIVKDSICRISSGSLAGSTLKLINGVKNLISFTGINPLDAVHSASLVPAKILGLEDELGSIREGKKANLTIVDDSFNTIMTIINGKIVYASEK